MKPNLNNFVVILFDMYSMQHEIWRRPWRNNEIIDIELLASHPCVFKFCQGLWILSFEESVQLLASNYRNVGGSTQVANCA